MTLIPNVTQWLDEQGFALEMHAAAAFRAAGFTIQQASHYPDPETGKVREIDVLAVDPDALVIVDIAFVVECKASKKPWALLCSPDTLASYNRIFAFGTLSQEAIAAVADRVPDVIERRPWLRKDIVAAYSVRHAFL